MRSSKELKAMTAFLRDVRRRGGLEPERMEVLEGIIRRVDHAVVVGDRRTMRKAWGDLARELCKAFSTRGE